VFVDIGANVGSYSVLAGAVVGAHCISIEPIPSAFNHLMDNININDISEYVTALNIGVGDREDKLRFTTGCDTVNHVLSDSERHDVESMDVLVKRVDDVLSKTEPALIKIDVEGFETKVIEGAKNTLQRKSLLGVIIELNGSGNRYGFDEHALHEEMLGYGFLPYKYSPINREIISLDGKNLDSGNTLYLRNIDGIRSRLNGSPRYHLRQVSVEV